LTSFDNFIIKILSLFSISPVFAWFGINYPKQQNLPEYRKCKAYATNHSGISIFFAQFFSSQKK